MLPSRFHPITSFAPSRRGVVFSPYWRARGGETCVAAEHGRRRGCHASARAGERLYEENCLLGQHKNLGFRCATIAISLDWNIVSIRQPLAAEEEPRMALRGAAAVCIGRHRNASSSLISIPSGLLRRSPQGFGSSSLQHQAGRSVRAIQGAAAEPVAPKKEDERQSLRDWKIKMLYDGDCPLCMREVDMLRERNKQYGTIKFVDISSADYSSEENQGLDYKTVMGRIHAILSDGTVVTDVEAFRRLYEQVGLGWVYAITKYEPIATIADSVYGVWAKYRLQITGRPPLEEILEARKSKGEMCNDSDKCKM
ncbi:uncharacterized protein At5g50100, chloroplastic [Syzygium oleosum]|uniref:uncharacterized protein At5g50100, chloroplastic n=1 Tax=Syzygium oleosum TaxID=219896 RepID=UPI0011D26372|nr:uncharacterized protein At5g50100, chloroplastic [Syzygium oleosum]